MIVDIWEIYFYILGTALSPVSTKHVDSYTWFILPHLEYWFIIGFLIYK